MLLAAHAAALSAHAQAVGALPGLRGPIRALGTTLRVLHVTAHPGDEDGALLLYQAQGQGAQVTLLTLTRGERGDNSESILPPTEQALLRTMEQLASDARYGVEQRFTRVVDFGFARTADEVFDRWGGHNAALGDIVRVIRETHPDIIVTPFDPASPDGDGQHQATAILVHEAFRAAADPKKFPEQLADGLTNGVDPWQAKRLFALVRSGAYTVTFNAGASGAGESESWQQQAARALAEQHSQRAILQDGSYAPRQAVRHYRLIESATGSAMADGARDFAEGLNYKLAALAPAAGLGGDETLLMQRRLKAMTNAVVAAQQSAADRADCITQITEYLRNLRAVEDRMLRVHPPTWLRAELTEKRKQAEQALLLAADVRVHARLMTDEKAGDEKRGTAYVLVPGANFAVQVEVESGAGVGLRVVGMELKPEGGRWTPRREWNVGDAHALFRGRVPVDAPFTRPQFLLDSEEDGAYGILDERNATRALPPASLQAIAEVEIEGEVVRASAPAQARGDSVSNPNAGTRTVVVAPPISVIVEPRIQWDRRSHLSYGEVEIRVRSNLAKLDHALLSVHAPDGWRAEPEHEVLDIEGRGQEHSYRFFLIQTHGGAGTFPLRAVVRWGGMVFDQGYSIVRGPGDRIAFDYRPSNGWLVSTDVDVPENLEAGYVGVPGDPIPATLRGINVKVNELDREELLHGRLERYWAIVLGPHAVDTRDDLAEARTRLLNYAKDGGAIVILGQSDAVRFSSKAPLPYALELGELGAARVSNEASAVELIEGHDDLFMDPNEIGEEDFRGWSEERGRYFALRWDAHYEPLLRMADPGQPPQEGSLLRARYGRGSVVYSGLSFSRQLSAGVPGALRLLLNLLSSGAELHR